MYIKLAFFGFLFFLSSVNFGQNKPFDPEYNGLDEIIPYHELINKIDTFVKQKKSGSYTFSYPNGKLLQKISFKDTTAIDVTNYYENGNIRIKYQYKCGKVSGKFASNFSSGKKALTANFINGKLNGKSIV
ncbi:MAG: hypothetical protein SFY56_06005 [Bacteroidota bacterium]|nr:hypothetical protein [Bacteroidota bacterium]